MKGPIMSMGMSRRGPSGIGAPRPPIQKHEVFTPPPAPGPLVINQPVERQEQETSGGMTGMMRRRAMQIGRR